MKKYLLAILLFPSIAYAVPEAVTSGNVGLLKLSTDTRSSRNWGEVNNANLDIIASTINTNINRLNAITTDTSTVLSLLQTTSTALSADLTVIRDSMTVISQSTSTIEGTLALRTQIWQEEGSALTGGDVTSLDCVGETLECTQSGSTVTINVSATASASGNSTFTFVVNGIGSVIQSTSVPLSDTIFAVGKSSWNTIDFRAFTGNVSTVAAYSFTIMESTPFIAGRNNWRPISQQLIVSTNNHFSVWYSTAFDLRSDNVYGIRVDTIPTSGLAASGWGVTGRAWKKSEQP